MSQELLSWGAADKFIWKLSVGFLLFWQKVICWHVICWFIQTILPEYPNWISEQNGRLAAYWEEKTLLKTPVRANIHAADVFQQNWLKLLHLIPTSGKLFPPESLNETLSPPLQAEGSSFLQMGASLEQQIVCMFKVQTCLSVKSKLILRVFWEKMLFFYAKCLYAEVCQLGPLRLINTILGHCDHKRANPWSEVLAHFPKFNTNCFYNRVYKFSLWHFESQRDNPS